MVDIKINLEEVEEIIKLADEEGMNPYEIAKELGLLNEQSKTLPMAKIVLKKIRQTARRVVESNNWTIKKEGKKVTYIAIKSDEKSRANKSAEQVLMEE